MTQNRHHENSLALLSQKHYAEEFYIQELCAVATCSKSDANDSAPLNWSSIFIKLNELKLLLLKLISWGRHLESGRLQEFITFRCTSKDFFMRFFFFFLKMCLLVFFKNRQTNKHTTQILRDNYVFVCVWKDYWNSTNKIMSTDFISDINVEIR